MIAPPCSAWNNCREDEKENQREQIVEENDGLVAIGQLEVDLRLSQKALCHLPQHHSRSLLPVSSMNTSSSVGRFR